MFKKKTRKKSNTKINKINQKIRNTSKKQTKQKKMINENKNFNNKSIKNNTKNKKLNLNDNINNKTLRNKAIKNINNDIKCKIKNFNINYISIANSGNMFDLNKSSIYSFNNNKNTTIKENNKNKINFLYLPLDDIQKIIEANANKQKLYNLKSIKNVNNESYNKNINKIKKKNNNRSTIQKKLTMIKKEKSVILCKKKNNSNNIIRKKIIESNKVGYFPSKLFKNQKKITNNEKYRNKNNEK